MNDDNRLFPHQKLDAYKLSIALCEAVFAARIRNAELKDQAERAASSQFLAINEGLPHTSKRMRRVYFERARASLCELVGAMDLSARIGAMDREDEQAAQAIARRVGAIVVGLLR
jgi:four helix bundle protein